MENNRTEMIRARMEVNGIPFREELPEMLAQYLAILTEWNERMDLTAVLEEDEMLDKHFMDSLAVLKTPLLDRTETVIDVGSGAGFPGLVLAMARPDISFTLLDAQRKRVQFLDAVCAEVSVENVTLIHARAEDGGRNRMLRERFDRAVARAVAPLNMLCELLLPFVKVGGQAVCWKGPALWNELDSGKIAAEILGGEADEPIPYPIHGRDWEHNLFPVRKVRPIGDVYPRNPGMLKARPLGRNITREVSP